MRGYITLSRSLREHPAGHKRMTHTDRDISALVKELRERLHLTQEQFAQRIGVTYSTLGYRGQGQNQ
jgi:DNA-binding transcriptional regulator YiaG